MKQAADWMIQKRRGKCVCVHGTSVLTVTSTNFGLKINQQKAQIGSHSEAKTNIFQKKKSTFNIWVPNPFRRQSLKENDFLTRNRSDRSWGHCLLIVESPHKGNISYVVQYMKKNANLAQYFAWIGQEVLSHGSEATRTIENSDQGGN